MPPISPHPVQFVDAWLDVINAKPDYWDQNAFNDMARAGWDPAKKVRAQQMVCIRAGAGGSEGTEGQYAQRAPGAAKGAAERAASGAAGGEGLW